jgi:hypothetical protein
MTDTRDTNSSVPSVVEEDSISTVKATSPTIDNNNMGAQAYSPEDQNNDIASLEVVDDADFDDFDIEGTGLGIDEDRFTAVKPIWRDVKFAIFFLIVFFIFIVTSMTLIIKYGGKVANESPNLPDNLPLLPIFDFKVIFLTIFTSIISFGVAILIFVFAGKNSIKFTEIGIKFVTGLFFLTGVVTLLTGQFIQGVSFIGLGGILILILFKYKPLIILASNILQVVITVLKKYPSTAVAALIGFFGNILFALILNLSVQCAYYAFGFRSNGMPKFDENGNPKSNITSGLVITILFLNFAGLYIIDVVKNVMHVTIGGIYGTWYYLENTFIGMPTNEGKGSFKRAMTYNFGSVCFGSLFVVLFQCIAVIILIGDKSLGVWGSLGDGILKLTSTGIGYFNLYAYSFVALYGVSMVKSAKSTYNFFRQRGLQAIINDFIISMSLGFYCIIASIFGVVLTLIYIAFIDWFFEIGQQTYISLAIYSFFVTINITSILIVTVVSGSSVFFFALNKDPAVFQESHPFEFQEISRCYPKILNKLSLD